MLKKVLVFLISLSIIFSLFSQSVIANTQGDVKEKKIIILNRSKVVKLSDDPIRVDFDLTNKEILELHQQGYIFEAVFMARDAYRQGEGTDFRECLDYFNAQLKDKQYWPGYNENWIKLLTECKDWKEVNKRMEEESEAPPDGEITEEFIRESFKKYDLKHGQAVTVIND